jgi:hypothetical protein
MFCPRTVRQELQELQAELSAAESPYVTTKASTERIRAIDDEVTEFVAFHEGFVARFAAKLAKYRDLGNELKEVASADLLHLLNQCALHRRLYFRQSLPRSIAISSSLRPVGWLLADHPRQPRHVMKVLLAEACCQIEPRKPKIR